MSNMHKVEEANYGVYVWNVTDRGILVNEDGDPLRVNAWRGSIAAMAEIKRVATYLGFPDGEPVFWSGRRAISDSEYEDQVARQNDGLLADPYDIPALIERARGGNG